MARSTTTSAFTGSIRARVGGRCPESLGRPLQSFRSRHGHAWVHRCPTSPPGACDCGAPSKAGGPPRASLAAAGGCPCRGCRATAGLFCRRSVYDSSPLPNLQQTPEVVLKDCKICWWWYWSAAVVCWFIGILTCLRRLCKLMTAMLFAECLPMFAFLCGAGPVPLPP